MRKKLKYYIGIDLGGTKIKGGVVDNEGNIILAESKNTEAGNGNKKIIDNISSLIESLLDKTNLSMKDIEAIGVGVAGIVDSSRGIVVCSYNLNFENFELAKKLQEKLSTKVKILNDANASTLAEYYFGAGVGYKDIVLLTLGTGVGGGAIINGNLLLGNNSAGVEFGHMVIETNGEVCSCGLKGCLEKYASATALKELTIKEMERDRTSKMWEVSSFDNVTSKTAFDYKDIDKTASKVVDSYINYLAVGLINISNIFRPEIIILSGGVSGQGENLTLPLQSILDKNIFASELTPKVKVVTSLLGEMSGVLGAVCNLFN